MAPCFVQLFGTIGELTVRNLLMVINQQLGQGIENFTVLLSSRGGNTHSGHTAYHHLKALPINLTTWNMGLVGSAAISLFCAGRRRCSVPEARFWLHCPDWTIQARAYDLTELRGIVNEMEDDLRVNADILAANSSQTSEQLTEFMCLKRSWSPDQAKTAQLIHEIGVPEVAAQILIVQ
jgi:ATP-dependent protease ClpP protease subunit